MNNTMWLLLGVLMAANPVHGHAVGVIEQGQKLWVQEVVDDKGEARACTSCHGTDLTQAGQHKTTQKTIKPMAKSVNSKRYTDDKKVAKWFKRNCKWTWGRECTEQEKSDILAYLLAQ